MDTAVDRFLGKYPTARLGLAAIVSIVVLADLIVLVGDTAAVSERPAPVASTPGESVAPSFDQSVQPTADPSVHGSAAAAPPASVSSVPTESVRPTPAPTRTAHAPAPAPPTSTTPRRPRPSSTHRTRSPFEERCRDGEIEPWLCHGMPN
jgi:pyruvate/2-oxoglutarate dehydrogenase complex dihydrolipoamide acyltransferase (E2) component